jgi:hypothetical protein
MILAVAVFCFAANARFSFRNIWYDWFWYGVVEGLVVWVGAGHLPPPLAPACTGRPTLTSTGRNRNGDFDTAHRSTHIHHHSPTRLLFRWVLLHQTIFSVASQIASPVNFIFLVVCSLRPHRHSTNLYGDEVGNHLVFSLSGQVTKPTTNNHRKGRMTKDPKDYSSFIQEHALVTLLLLRWSLVLRYYSAVQQYVQFAPSTTRAECALFHG